jgi:hypothetical protein
LNAPPRNPSRNADGVKVDDDGKSPQARTQFFSQLLAHQALWELLRPGAEDPLSTTDLERALYRRLSPIGHPGAALKALDVNFLMACTHLGGLDLLKARHLACDHGHVRSAPALNADPDGPILRSPPSVHQAIDGHSLMLGLSVEAEKLLLNSHAAISGVESALDVWAAQTGFAGDTLLEALKSGGTERLTGGAPPLSGLHLPEGLDPQMKEPVVVMVDGAHRLHDLLSPYVRQLRPLLSELSERPSYASDDDLYTQLPIVEAADAQTLEERDTGEAQWGFLASPFVRWVELSRLKATQCDARAQKAVVALSRKKAWLALIPPHPEVLGQLLRQTDLNLVGVALHLEGICEDIVGENAWGILDGPSGAISPLGGGAGNDGLVVTIPSLGLFPANVGSIPAHVAIDGAAFALFNAISRQRAFFGRKPGLPVAVRVSPLGHPPMASDAALALLDIASGWA